MMQVELNRLLKQELGEDACRRGWVIYTGLDALIHGRYYVMGYNPRTDPANRPLLETTNNATDWSAYTKQCWNCAEPACPHMGASGRLTKREPHQNRMIDLADLLDTKPEFIFSANAIFIESPTARELQNANELWDKCWRVHQTFLALVRPEWIICLGNGKDLSSFQLIKDRGADTVQVVDNPCAPGSRPEYRIGKLFHASLDICETNRLNVKVLGLPHPSRFNMPKELKDFIRTSLRLSCS